MKLSKHQKLSIERQFATPKERGPIWESRPVVFTDKRRAALRRAGKLECLKAMKGGID